MNATGARAIRKVSVMRVTSGHRNAAEHDVVAAEEPMEIRISAGRARVDMALAVTMRTPGNDFELAAGFLYGEGVVREREDILSLRYCLDAPEPEKHNVVHVRLRSDALPPAEHLERHFTMTSACGVCGKAHLDALEVRCPAPLAVGPRISATTIAAMPEKLRAAQALFGRTGGLHAAGLYDARGELLAVREDVGRHNALDKLIGWAFLEGRLPLEGGVVCVSGRASYELLQKSVMAGAPVLAAVSAPSSMAVEVAERFGVTLIGFLRGERFNVYTGAERVAGGPRPARATAAVLARAAEAG